jgi:hypothetical protein
MGVDKFLIKTSERGKRANLATILPAVSLPALGAFAGSRLEKSLGLSPGVGALVGGISGGVGGQLSREMIEQNQRAQGAQGVPPGAPYALDPTDQGIPAWALQGAQMLQPAMAKTSAHEDRESPMDVIMGEVPGANPIMDALKRDPSTGQRGGLGAGARTFGSMAMGGVPGGLLGTGLAHGIEHLAGKKNIQVPGLGLSLSDVLGSVGGALGATKGLRWAQSL